MIDARNGPSDGASAVERRLMPIPGVFYGGGCCYMACRGLMLGGISDVLLISHGPVGCAYYAGISGYEGPGPGAGANAKEGADATAASVEVPAFAARTFVTCMDESDIVFGGEEKLANAIDEAVARYHPEAIAVCATCPVGIIGDDIEQVARDFAKAIGCPVLGAVPRDALVQKAEAHQKTVVEYAPESSQTQAYRKLAQALEDNEIFFVPDPLSREALHDLVLRYGD